MICENLRAERVVIAMEYVFVARPLGGQVEAADAAEERSVCQMMIHCGR